MSLLGDCRVLYCTCSLRLFRSNEHINAVLLRANEHTRNIFPFTVGSFLNNFSIQYIYQFYNFTLSYVLFLKGLHISLGIASCLETQQQFQFASQWYYQE